MESRAKEPIDPVADQHSHAISFLLSSNNTTTTLWLF
jgi:hypothetical protein